MWGTVLSASHAYLQLKSMHIMRGVLVCAVQASFLSELWDLLSMLSTLRSKRRKIAVPFDGRYLGLTHSAFPQQRSDISLTALAELILQQCHALDGRHSGGEHALEKNMAEDCAGMWSKMAVRRSALVVRSSMFCAQAAAAMLSVTLQVAGHKEFAASSSKACAGLSYLMTWPLCSYKTHISRNWYTRCCTCADELWTSQSSASFALEQHVSRRSQQLRIGGRILRAAAERRQDRRGHHA